MKTYRITMALVSSLSLSLIGTSMGCAVSSPAPETDSASETILVDDESHAALEGVEMRIERRAGEPAFSLMEGSDWKTVAPGVWELPSKDGNAQRVAAGEAGHRFLVAQADAELDALYARRDAEAMTPEIAEKIANAEEMRATAQESMKRAAGDTQTLAASCNFSLYTGASSPVTSPPVAGAAALAQVVCSGGCVTFTVTSQACCGGFCSGSTAFTRTVCGTPWTAGTVVSGAGLGFATVNLNPPNITQSSSNFFCQ